MKILSFDQATNKCGYSLFENEKLIEYGSEDFSKCKNLTERISKVKQWMNELIHITKAEIFAIEDVQYQNNLSAFKPLTELLGVSENNFFENNLLFKTIDSNTWKSVCSIKGKKREEQKANAIKFVKEKFGIDVSSDEADAICIGWYMQEKIIPILEFES